MESRRFISVGIFLTFVIAAAPAFVDGARQPATSAASQQKQKPDATKPDAVKASAIETSTEGRLGTLDPRTNDGLSVQIALDRAGFSPGELDGAVGNNTRKALRAFQEAKRLPVTGSADAATREALGEVVNHPLAQYAISGADAAGPYVDSVPVDMMEKSKLPSLSYASIQEMLAERFHSSPKLLQRLNPDAMFERGEVILVPNVDAFYAPSVKTAGQAHDASGANAKKEATPAIGTPTKKGDAATAAQSAKAGANDYLVTVTDQTKTLTVENIAGEVVFYAPVTVGSKNDPLPVGEWKVNGVSIEPPFNYNPDLFWDADPSHAKAKIPPGPNNPVGIVWIDLSKEHYGIHGTPEPSRIGYTESHGCIRLTNWDAMRLAGLVAPGTKVVLR